jgi:hypothetical protein
MSFLQLCYFVFCQRGYDHRCYLTPYCSYCGENAGICMKENGVCVSHYSSSRRDDGDADLSLSEPKFSFRVDNVSRGRPRCALHRRTRELVTGDV